MMDRSVIFNLYAPYTLTLEFTTLSSIGVILDVSIESQLSS